jgi:hypothetical protein
MQHVVNMMRLAAVAEEDIGLLSGLLRQREGEGGGEERSPAAE